MLDDDNPLSLTLQRAFLVNMYDVLAMLFHDIDWLDYVDDQGKEIMLPNGYRYMIRIIKHYDSYRTADGDPISDDWKSVTANQYNEYRLSADYANVSSLSSSSPVPPSGTIMPSPSASRTRDAVFDFKKGIKHDSGSFLMYKDEKQWDTWQCSTMAQARAQDVHEILDTSYLPTSSEDQQLFAMKQEFMYSVFKRTLQTDMGKALFCRHKSDFDAQTLYQSLLEYSIKSTKASLDTSKLLAYITITKLRAVHNQADQLKTTSGTALTYEEYSRLLLSAAASYDNELLPHARQNTTPSHCSVYMQDLINPRDSVLNTTDEVYDIDTDIDIIQAHVSNQQHAPGSRMPFPHWKSLSPNTQAIWDTIPDSDKALILGLGNKNPPMQRV
jgi:hypothetical protein